MAEIANNSIDIQVVETGGENAQYFWHNTTDSGAGEGAGAHVTQIPKADFVADPENGGGNVLIDSGGMYVRDGIDAMGSFTNAGAQIGKTDEARTFIDADSITLYTPENVPAFNVDIGENASEQTVVDSKSLVGPEYVLEYQDSITEDYSGLLGDIANGDSFNIRLDWTYAGADLHGSADFIKGTSDTATLIQTRCSITMTYTAPSTLTFTYSTGTWHSENITLEVVTVQYKKIVRDTLIEMRGNLTIDSESVTWTHPAQVFVVEQYTHPYSTVSSGNTMDWNETVTKAGYYPVGIVGVRTARAALLLNAFRLDNKAVGTCDIYINARAVASASASTAYCDILWVKAE